MAVAVHKYKKPDTGALKRAQRKPVERIPFTFDMIRGRVHKYPMPTPADNAQLYTRIAAARIAGKGQLAERLLGDLALRNQESILMIISQPWVQYYARAYNIPMADLFQNGFIGLARALKYWSPEKGTVGAYCSKGIKQDLWERIAEDAPIPHSVDSHKRKNDYEGVLKFVEGKKLPLSNAVIENSGLTRRQRKELCRLKSEADVSKLKMRVENLRHYLTGAAKPHASLDAEAEGRTLHEKIPGKTYVRTALPRESLKPNATLYLAERLAPKKRMIVLLANLQLVHNDKRLKGLAERTVKELGPKVDEQGILKCLSGDAKPIFAEIGVLMGYPKKSAAQGCHVAYKTAIKQLERLAGATSEVGSTFRRRLKRQYSDVSAASVQYRWASLYEKKAMLRRLGVSDTIIQQFSDKRLQKLPSAELERIVPRLMKAGLEEGVPLLTTHSLYSDANRAVSVIREKLGKENKKS
ncbi:MAG: hypothetical protein AABW72_01360 [archaeon]